MTRIRTDLYIRENQFNPCHPCSVSLNALIENKKIDISDTNGMGNRSDKRKVHFAEYGKDAEIIGFFTCGGCPGRCVFRLVDSLLKHDIDVIHLSSCMLMEKSYSNVLTLRISKR